MADIVRKIQGMQNLILEECWI